MIMGFLSLDPYSLPGSCEVEEQPIWLLRLRIDVLLAITAAILVFLGVFGSFRRCCSNRAFTVVAFTAYGLLPTIITYTLGLIQSTPLCSLLLPLWLACLVIALGSVDSYTAHSIEDIEQWKSFNIDSAANCFMASWLIASYVTQSGKIWCTALLFVILFMKVDEKARALMFASNSTMQKNSKLVVDYMNPEHDGSASSNADPAASSNEDPAASSNASSNEDPDKMRGCKYLVRVPNEAKVLSLCSPEICWQKATLWQVGKAPNYRQRLEMTDEVITVDKVWKCKGRLLSVNRGDPDNRLKDLCLSFSLFKFICLRFTDYSLPQEARDELRRWIEHILFERNDHERVFRLIEIELAFLFDLLYTKYPVNLNRCRAILKFILLAILVAAALISLYLAINFKKDWGYSDDDRFAVLVTILLMMSILIVEFVQFGIMIFSEWAKVTYICKYVQSKWLRSNRCAEKLIEMMCGVWLLKPWGRQLRQYSLLKSYSYSPWKCTHNKLTTAYLDLKRNGQKQIAPTNLSAQVTKAIAESLKKVTAESLGNNPTSNLEIGIESLKSNFLAYLSWVYDLKTTTQVIMVWHIATTFCEHEKPLRDALPCEHRDIATKLSQYLAYLVAFAPGLLPDNACETEYIFDCTVSEARDLFQGSSVSMGDKIQKLKDIGNQQEKETSLGIMARGAKLGTELVKREDVWKVLADFWAEMMLYVAPSNDAAAHAKYLTMGGEFVTHVWVLVSHMSITRGPRGGEQHNDPERN